jgi:hypothetical protein
MFESSNNTILGRQMSPNTNFVFVHPRTVNPTSSNLSHDCVQAIMPVKRPDGMSTTTISGGWLWPSTQRGIERTWSWGRCRCTSVLLCPYEQINHYISKYNPWVRSKLSGKPVPVTQMTLKRLSRWTGNNSIFRRKIALIRLYVDNVVSSQNSNSSFSRHPFLRDTCEAPNGFTSPQRMPRSLLINSFIRPVLERRVLKDLPSISSATLQKSRTVIAFRAKDHNVSFLDGRQGSQHVDRARPDFAAFPLPNSSDKRNAVLVEIFSKRFERVQDQIIRL